ERPGSCALCEPRPHRPDDRRADSPAARSADDQGASGVSATAPRTVHADGRHSRMMIGRGAVFPIAFLVVAEVAMRASQIQSDTLAAPSTIFMEGVRIMLDGSLLQATFQTFVGAAWGLVMG